MDNYTVGTMVWNKETGEQFKILDLDVRRLGARFVLLLSMYPAGDQVVRYIPHNDIQNDYALTIVWPPINGQTVYVIINDTIVDMIYRDSHICPNEAYRTRELAQRQLELVRLERNVLEFIDNAPVEPSPDSGGYRTIIDPFDGFCVEYTESRSLGEFIFPAKETAQDAIRYFGQELYTLIR